MDPTTTLFTFLLQTDPSVQVVHLVGSWDNFSQTYSMQRDIRRDRGQWRGCYSFKDIICDGDAGTSPRRDGGLKMGETYYFYYELDGSTETYDPSLPSTSACPYLPGQTVNTLWVPVEHSLRKRSASLSSMREGDLKTMNPDHKFATPRPAPPPPAIPGPYRLGSAPLTVSHRRSARSLSPSSGWSLSPRRLFTRKASSSSLAENALLSPRHSRSTTPSDDRQSIGSSDGSRSREISPDSLRRFLSDESLSAADSLDSNDRISLAIPEDIAEENEDDDNFATSTTSENMPQFTVLSPPPTQHSHSSRLSSPRLTPISTPRSRGSTLTPRMESARPAPPTRTPPRIPPPPVEIPTGQPPSLAGISFFTPPSPDSPASNDLPSFYHSDDDDDDDEDEWFTSSQADAGGASAPSRNLDATLSTYSLPRSSAGASKLSAEERTPMANLGSPALVARNSSDVPVGNTSLLTNPIPNSGLDELVSELSWIADVIRGKAS